MAHDPTGEARGGSLERIRTTLAHREPDRAPLDIGGTRVSGIHIRPYEEYRRRLGMPPSRARWQIRYLQQPRMEEDFRRWLGVDLESVDPLTVDRERDIEPDGDRHHYVDLWGCEWRMPDGATACSVHHAPLSEAESASDLERYPWPRGDDPAILANLERDAREIWHDHRRAVVLGRPFVGTLEMINYLCGYEKALVDLASNPSFTEALMDRIVEFKLAYYREAIARVMSAGVDFIIVNESEDLGSQRDLLLSPETYRRVLKGRHAEVFRAIRECSGGRAFVHLHSDGAIRKLIPDLIEIGVQILNPVQFSAAGMDTRDLKRDFGDALVFHGGVIDSQTLLPHGTPKQIRDEVHRRIDELAPGGGFIFTPVQAIQHDVPFENFMALVEAYREYRW